ncbi:class I SAM-dependent methyltransferase [Brevifollis gellanilyticus]|nr:class I SAM-dependent methyltransferase [Brevifollis gellanilyticus]
MTSLAPTQRFSDRVENYVRFRPGYPQEIVTLLRENYGLTGDAVIADLGSGTGISTALFLEAGCTVHAVEPNREMREAAERLLHHHAKFHSVAGSAEATTLPDHCADFVVAAQAFHWFDAKAVRQECDRILKPGGWVVLIWNERQLDATPFLRAYETLLLQFSSDYATVRHENIDTTKLAQFFKGPHVTHTFANAQHFDFAGLKGRLLSSSYAPAAGDLRHEPMLAELQQIFDDHHEDGRVTFSYDTKVHVGH